MEGDVPRSFDISRTLRQNTVRWMLSHHHSCGCGAGWLDHRFHLRRELGVGQSCNALPRVIHQFRPIPRHLIRHQISPRGLCPPFVLANTRPRPFIPPSPRPGCTQYRRGGDPERWWFGWAVDRRPAFKLIHFHWVPGVISGERNEIHRPSIVVLARWSPPPEAHLDLVSRGRSFVDNGVGGGVFPYPQLS